MGLRTHGPWCCACRAGFGMSVWGLESQPGFLAQLGANVLGSLALTEEDANSGSCHCHALSARSCAQEALHKHFTTLLNNLGK